MVCCELVVFQLFQGRGLWKFDRPVTCLGRVFFSLSILEVLLIVEYLLRLVERAEKGYVGDWELK